MNIETRLMDIQSGIIKTIVFGSHDMHALSVGPNIDDDGKVCLYYMNDPFKDQEFKMEVRGFRTGETVDMFDPKFINTLKIRNGIFHFFWK